ncbi:hypothetical protein M404DRAFT_1000357 [Pisolithus tinctorius Marx 270]|uniref:Uncharacterized protein n=1 Tax=Pisolithus tinctorius Marx 270 TaxID=870435 RepID=A0A0C3J702_PISTI|nr:hypothetical protein M404DRAFT_1000357 [Pisolithus tinctorius Marx 270]
MTILPAHLPPQPSSAVLCTYSPVPLCVTIDGRHPSANSSRHANKPHVLLANALALLRKLLVEGREVQCSI